MAAPSPMETKYLHRTLLVALAFSLLFGLIVGRLYYLQFARHEHYRKVAEDQHHMTVKITPQRGSILSANGYPLAASTFRKSAYLAPEFLRAPEFLKKNEADMNLYRQLARELARILYGDPAGPDEEDAGSPAEETIRKNARDFEERMLRPSNLVLKAQLDTDTEIELRGRVEPLGDTLLTGTIEGKPVTVFGNIQLGTDVILKGKISGGDDIILKGKASNSTRRNVVLQWADSENRSVTFEGRISRRLDFPLRRKLPESKIQELIGLRERFGLLSPTLYFLKEGKREYPNGSLAAHVIGFTASDAYGDNKGLAGAEFHYNDELNGSLSKDTVEVTIFGQSISPLGEEALTSATGNTIHLTINKAIQQYAEEALAKQVEEYGGDGGACVVMEVPTGAVLAMASYPTFDPADRSQADPESFRNRCLIDAISPGSVMKVFTALALLENNKMNPNEIINCEMGSFRFPIGARSTRRIRDSHPLGNITVRQAFSESSNVGFVKLGLRLEKEEFYKQWGLLGFGRKTGIGLPGEARGRCDPVMWNMSSRISVSIGYEMRITPIQVAAAAAAIANGGRYMRPHILKEIRSPKNELIRRFEPEFLRRVCSPQTSRILLDLMEEVVLTGTGKDKADLADYRVGGKTGTTIKDDRPRPDQDPDEPRYIASFLGVVPIEKPRLVIYSWVDEPQKKRNKYGYLVSPYGGDVAAPVFREVAQNAMRILGVEPSLLARRNTSPGDGESPGEPEGPDFSPALPDVERFALARSQGIMPDLTGLTIREVSAQLHRMKIDAQLVGWGVATRQQPPPGDPLPEDVRGFVIFGSPYADR